MLLGKDQNFSRKGPNTPTYSWHSKEQSLSKGLIQNKDRTRKKRCNKKYAQRMLDLTTDTQVDKNYSKLNKKTREILSPLGIQFEGYTDKDKEPCLLS